MNGRSSDVLESLTLFYFTRDDCQNFRNFVSCSTSALMEIFTTQKLASTTSEGVPIPQSSRWLLTSNQHNIERNEKRKGGICHPEKPALSTCRLHSIKEASGTEKKKMQTCFTDKKSIFHGLLEHSGISGNQGLEDLANVANEM